MQHITFKLNPRDLSQVTAKGQHRIGPGSYTIFVGGSQPTKGGHGLAAELQITGEANLPR
jgi:hypothetical protein